MLRFPAEYNGAQEHCQDASCIAAVEAVLKELTGRSWMLRVESLAVPTEGSSAQPSDGRGNGSSVVGNGRRNAREEAEILPLVKRALDVLGGSLQRVDEGFGVLPSAQPNGEDES